MLGLSDEELAQAVIPTFLYLLETTGLTGDDIVFIFNTVSKQAKEVAMTGMQKLQQETVHKVVKGVLKLGMDAKTIADTFELDIKEVSTAIETIRQEKG